MWFLFYNEDDHIVIDTQSSKEPRKFVFLQGSKAVIKYYAFGMHLKSGLKIKAVDKRKENAIKVKV